MLNENSQKTESRQYNIEIDDHLDECLALITAKSNDSEELKPLFCSDF